MAWFCWLVRFTHFSGLLSHVSQVWVPVTFHFGTLSDSFTFAMINFYCWHTQTLIHSATPVSLPMKEAIKSIAKQNAICLVHLSCSNKFSLCHASSCFNYAIRVGSIEFLAKSGKFSIILAHKPYP